MRGAGCELLRPRIRTFCLAVPSIPPAPPRAPARLAPARPTSLDACSSSATASRCKRTRTTACSWSLSRRSAGARALPFPRLPAPRHSAAASWPGFESGEERRPLDNARGCERAAGASTGCEEPPEREGPLRRAARTRELTARGSRRAPLRLRLRPLRRLLVSDEACFWGVLGQLLEESQAGGGGGVDLARQQTCRPPACRADRVHAYTRAVRGAHGYTGHARS